MSINTLKFFENETTKKIRSENYNYNFNKLNGQFIRWGKTFNDDPIMSPFPEILDIEVEEKCNGVPGLNGVEAPCSFCYKSNTKTGRSMSFDTFKTILDKTIIKDKSSFLTQIAFGADAGAKNNPNLFKMMKYSRELGVIPNITVANVDDDIADKLADVCGAVAVSRYENKDVCYDTIKRLTDRGMKQVNIHAMLSSETFERVKETLADYLTDPRLSKLNAIVILSLKKRGRGEKFSPVTAEQFKEVVDFALTHNIPFGHDSCSAGKFRAAVTNYPNYESMLTAVEPCESTLFSQYINVEGKFYSCSFCENAPSFPNGIDVTTAENFIRDVWNHEYTVAWRNNLLSKRETGDWGCPVYEV